MKRILQFTHEQHLIGVIGLLGIGMAFGIVLGMMQLGAIMEMLKN